MRFFRGLAVPFSEADEIAAQIRSDGLATNAWRWKTEHWRPDPKLIGKENLSLDDTRPKGVSATPAVCACGDLEGASYYASSHNRNEADDTPLLIEFEAPIGDVAIDGKDCLYTVFQMGDPQSAQSFMRDAYGEVGLQLAERAWQLSDQQARIALCDLLIHHPDAIAAHHNSRVVIAGRHGTIFKSAFTVALPILPSSIVAVWKPDEAMPTPQPNVRLDQLLRSGR
jgi:hypothetical protein